MCEGITRYRSFFETHTSPQDETVNRSVRNYVRLTTNVGSTSLLLMLIALTVFRAQSFAQQSSPGQATVWDGAYTEDQAKRGGALYSKECSKCHGQSLSDGEEAPPLAGGVFLANWGGLTVGDLFERMRSSMPQDDPGKLSSQQYADILAFILKGNEFPAGKMEVGTHAEMLKQIVIEPNKPSGASTEPPATQKPASESKSSSGGGDAAKGKKLFASVGCAGCHGPLAKGEVGPKIAPPPLPLPQLLKYVRKPSGVMTPFSEDQVSDDQLADIYAFLQSLSQPSKN
jgi:S-disulfanyl-L-cysteine oxidoreductase SoxD